MAAPFRSPLRSALRSPLYSPLVGKYGTDTGYPYVNTETRTLVNAITASTSDAHKAALDAFFTDIKANIGLSYFRWIHIGWLATEQGALLNAVTPSETATNVGSLTHTPGVGFTGDGTGKISTGILAGSQTKDDSHLSAWIETSAASLLYVAGGRAGSHYIREGAPGVSTPFSSLHTTTAVNGTANCADGVFYVADRTTTLQELDMVGVQIDSTAVTSPTNDTTAANAQSICFCGTNLGGVSTATVGAGSFGTYLGATKRTAFKSALNTLRTALNA